MSDKLKFCLLGAVLLLGTALPACLVHALFYQKLLPASGEVIQVKPHTSASGFVRQLKKQGLVSYPGALLFFLKLSGKSARLQAGYYSLESGSSLWHLVEKVVHGDVIQCEFSFIEGMRLSQVLGRLDQAQYLDSHPVDLRIFQQDKLSSEGLFLADTYRYTAGSSKQQLLQMANRELLRKLDYYWRHRASNLPYESAYQLLIAASIVEKETATDAERGLISGVIVNRLQKHMRLQMDPTVIYALGAKYRGRLTVDDLKIDSPYNTYRYHGLPPTPIALISEQSMKAAANPIASDYLYYVAKGDGNHQFSTNYRQHQQAVSRFRAINSRDE